MTLNNILKVAKGTCLEIFKTKIVYIGIILMVILILGSLLAKSLVYGVQEKLLIDFSLGLQTIFITILSIFMGSNLIMADLDNKYIYMLLSRPLKKSEYLFGKTLGLLFVVFVLNSFLSFSSLLMFVLNDGAISSVLIHAQILMFFKSAILILLSITFTLIFEKYLSIFFSMIVLFCGYSIPKLLSARGLSIDSTSKSILTFVNYLVPNFNKIDLNNLVGYYPTLPVMELVNIYLYATTIIIIIYLFLIFIFRNREL